MGYTLCPHVAYDLYILHYSQPCRYKLTRQTSLTNTYHAPKKPPIACSDVANSAPDWAWSDTREVGKCHFCVMEEGDKKERKKRAKEEWGRVGLHEGRR